MESEGPSKSLEEGSVEPDSSFEKINEKGNSSPSSGNNGISEESKTHQDKQIENVCIFCQLNEDNEFKYGKLYRLEDADNGRMITAHHYCLFFASGLCQKGSDNEGIQGFLANDIQKEVSRASRLKCSFCMKKGASVGCCIKKCRQCYHYPCGRDNGSLFRFYDDFVSFCSTHRPLQEFSTAEAINLSLVKCPVCLEEVPNEPGFDVLKTPCCHNTFLHRDCIQQQALASGYYFFRCPICNNQKEFRDEMRSFGIHVPEQDAAWEREEGAFQELYQRHNKCDMEDCVCPKGNEHATTQGKWQIVLCDFCGSVGCHLECGRLERPSQDWACQSCRGMLSTDDTSGLLFESTPCKKKGRARSAMKLKGKTPRAGIKNKKVKKSAGSIEVDIDTDSPSTSRDGITDDSEISLKEKKKKKKMKKMKGEKKKSKSSQPPTLTRADLSPVRPVLSGDGPKTPKLSPIWDNFVIGKKHGGKGFKRHVFGKHNSSKLKGQPVSLKTLMSQKQNALKGAGNALGGKKKSQKACAGNLNSASKQVGCSKNKTGKTIWPSTLSGGDGGSQSAEPETSGGKKKVPKSQHAVIFQSQSKLFKSGCPMRAKEDLASAFMKRSLATVRGEILGNLPLVRLCKMALAEGDDVENVQAAGWKRALISTTQDMRRKTESGAKDRVKVHFSRMSMRRRVDKKVVPAPKRKSEQGVVRSTRSKINSEQLTNDILGESAKNVLFAVLTQSKPVDLKSYLHHRSESEKINEGESKLEKDESEGNDCTAKEVSTVDEIINCPPEKPEEKNDPVNMNESEVSGLKSGKNQCLRSSKKSSDSLAKFGIAGALEVKEDHSAEVVLEAIVVSALKVKNDVPKEKIFLPDSVSEKEIVGVRSSPRLGLSSKFSPCQKSESTTKDMPIEVEDIKNPPLHLSSDNVQKVLDVTVGTGVRSSPRLGSTCSVNRTARKDKQIETEDGKSSSDKVKKVTVPESPSEKVRISSIKLPPFQNEDENTIRYKKENSKSSPLSRNSPQKEKESSGLGKTAGVSNNLMSHLTAEKLRSSPRLRSTELQDTPPNHKDRNQKNPLKGEQEASLNENADTLRPDTGKPLRASLVSEDSDEKSTDPQNNGQEDVSIVAVFTNTDCLKKSPETKCRSATQSDGKRKEGSAMPKRMIEQHSPKTEGTVLQEILKSNHKMSYEDVYKQEKRDSSKGLSKKDSCEEKVGSKSVRHAKGDGTYQKRSRSNCSEDIAILGVFKLGQTNQRKAKIEVLSQVQTKEKKSTSSLRSEKRKRDRSSGRDVGQKSLKVTTGNANTKEIGGSSPSSVKSLSLKASDVSKQKAKKTLNDYFQTADKKSQPSGSDAKRTVSSVSGSVPTSSPVVKTNSNSLITKSGSLSEAEASSPLVKVNLCSDTKPMAKTKASIETDTSLVVKTNPSPQTEVTEDVTFVGIFKNRGVKDSQKQYHVPNTSKDSYHSQKTEDLNQADLPNKKLQGSECTKKIGKMPGIPTICKTLSFTDSNISENDRKSTTEITVQGRVKIERRQTPNRQTPNKKVLSSGNTAQYVLSSDYVSHTPPPQKRESNSFYRTSQYSWPLPKRELDMDIVILGMHKPNPRQRKSRSRLFTDGTEKDLKVSKEASLSLSSKGEQTSSVNCKEEVTVILATTPEKTNPGVREILSSKSKQPSKRKCSEMDGVDGSTAESLPFPNKENSNLNTTKQWKDEKGNHKAELSLTEGETGKEDSVSKRRSKRLKRDESSGGDLNNFTNEEDIFPQSESEASQNGHPKEVNTQHCNATGKVQGKVSMKDLQKRQTTPQKRVLLQRPLSLCKVVEGDSEGEVSRSTRRKCSSDLKVKKPLTVQKISRRQLVMH